MSLKKLIHLPSLGRDIFPCKIYSDASTLSHNMYILMHSYCGNIVAQHVHPHIHIAATLLHNMYILTFILRQHCRTTCTSSHSYCGNIVAQHVHPHIHIASTLSHNMILTFILKERLQLYILYTCIMCSRIQRRNKEIAKF